MESSYQKFAKDVAVIGVAHLLVALSGFILLSLLTKTVGVHDYGIWTQVNITVTLLWTLANLGLPFAVIRFLAGETDRNKVQEGFYSVISVVFLTTFIASCLLTVFASSIAKAFFDGALGIVRIIGLIVLISSLNRAYLSLFRTFQQMKSYSILSTTKAYAQVGIVAYLVLNGFGIFSIVLSIVAVEAILFAILFCLIKSQIGIKKPHLSGMRQYLSFGVPTVPANISSWVISSSDRYVIGYFLGATMVGIYSAGYVLGNLLFMFAGVLGFVLPPVLSKFYDEGRLDKVKTILRYSLRYFLALAIPFVFGAILLSKQVLVLFSTPAIALQGYIIVPIVALSTLVFGFGGVISHILILVKQTKIIGAAWLLAALVNLSLNILIIPYIGILGAAIATLIAHLLATSVLVRYSFKEFKFNIDWRFLIKSLIASAIMALVIWSMHPQSNSATIITVLVGVAVYGVVLFLLKGFSRKEISFFRGLLRRSATTANPNNDKAK